MKIIKKTLWVVLLLIPAFGFSQLPEAEKKASETIHQFLLEKFPDHNPGASVLVIKGDKTLLRKGYGMANLESKTPVSPEMIFRIGSITKQFTSAAILKLSEQGKIRIDDEITKYLPDYPTNGKRITVGHLLNHTSGIKSYTSLPALMAKDLKAKEISVQDVINAFKDQPMDFDPGDEYRYNNSGYFLLGAIIEKVSGDTWSNYVQKNFFGPLKMKSTFTEDKNIPLAATGYAGSGNAVADYVHPSVPFSAGSIFSTVDDLWKWNKAIFNYRVVKKESLEKAWAPLVLNSGVKQSYGYGWQLGRLNDKKVIAHGGAIDGFLSYALYVPESKLFVTILCNSMSHPLEEIAFKVATFASGLKEMEPTPISLDEKKLEEYVGVYKISDKEDRIISREGNHLFSQRTGGVKYEIYPYEADAFFYKDSPFRLRFLRDAAGVIQRFELTGRESINQEGNRTDKAIPAERVAIKIDPTIFDAYVGQYEITPGFILTMSREGEKFFSQATGQQILEIFPESETKFFLKVVDAQVEFIKDASGAVVVATLYQGGRKMLAKKLTGELSKQRTAIKLSAELYDRYTGDYELAPGFILSVRRDGDKMMAQATGQPAAEIFAESEKKFFYKVVDAQLEFIKDDKGIVTGMTFHQGGNSRPAKKIK